MHYRQYKFDCDTKISDDINLIVSKQKKYYSVRPLKSHLLSNTKYDWTRKDPMTHL